MTPALQGTLKIVKKMFVVTADIVEYGFTCTFPQHVLAGNEQHVTMVHHRHPSTPTHKG